MPDEGDGDQAVAEPKPRRGEAAGAAESRGVVSEARDALAATAHRRMVGIMRSPLIGRDTKRFGSPERIGAAAKDDKYGRLRLRAVSGPHARGDLALFVADRL